MKYACTGLPTAAVFLAVCSCSDDGQITAHPAPRSQIAPRFTEHRHGGVSVQFDLAEYIIIISNGHPFGIVTLRAAEQVLPFSHDQLPLGDWEWFWLEKPDTSSTNTDMKVKLIDPEWSLPTVTYGEPIVITFWREDAVHPGVRLSVEYHLFGDRAAFDVHYLIYNGGGADLIDPSVMVGFPGFLDNNRIFSVGTRGREVRSVTRPYENFGDEAVASGLEAYLLQRSVDPDSGSVSGQSEATVFTREGDEVFSLTTRFEADHSYSYVYSAHTNKTEYLTSHLYAYMESIPRGATKRLVVHHSLESRRSSR